MMRRDERAASVEGGEPEQKAVSKCWVLNDMFAFENVGFCRDVQVAGSTLKAGEGGGMSAFATHTHTLTHSLTHTHTHSLTHSLPHAL